MTPAQREAAERLADWHEAYAWHCDSDATTVPGRDGNRRNVSHREAAALLRELAAEPVQEPVGWLHDETGDFEPSHKPWMDDDEEWVPLYAAPQQPMRCPEDGGACGAGGYCRPEPVQRRPLSDEQINRLDTEAIHGGPDSQYAFRFARAVEKAHSITGEQE